MKRAIPTVDHAEATSGSAAVPSSGVIARMQEDGTRELLQEERLRSVSLLAGGIAREVEDPASFVLENLASMREILRQLRGREGDLVDDPVGIVDELDEMVRESILGLGRVRDIVARLRAFTRVEEDRIEPVDLNDLVESACMLAGNEIRRHATLVKRFEPLPPVPADPGKLAQVLVHLLVNAAQAFDEYERREHDEVVVTTEVDVGGVVVIIEDSGCGMSDELQTRIFEPFFSTKPRGIGLGLSLSEEIVRKHRGTISAKSELGRGTRVRIRLPLETGLRAKMPEPVETPLHLVKPLRILVVDDEPLVSKALARTLQRNHQVVVAESGAQAIEILATGRPFDVVVCDLMMPDVDGADVYEHAKETRPDLVDRFLFLTGGAYVPKLRTFAEAHRSAMLDKPVTPNALKDALKRTAKVLPPA